MAPCQGAFPPPRHGKRTPPLPPAGRHTTRNTTGMGWATHSTNWPRDVPSPQRRRSFFPALPRWAKRRRAPAAAETEATGTTPAMRRPTVSTSRCRVRPVPCVPGSSPRSPPNAVVLTLWRSKSATGGMGGASRVRVPTGAYGVRPPLPVPPVAPVAEIPGDTRPRRRRMGEPAPWAAPVDHSTAGMDDRAPSQRARVSTRLGGGSTSLSRAHATSVRSVGYGAGFLPTVYCADAPSRGFPIRGQMTGRSSWATGRQQRSQGANTRTGKGIPLSGPLDKQPLAIVQEACASCCIRDEPRRLSAGRETAASYGVRACQPRERRRIPLNARARTAA
jgi:hypothetical protein